MNPKRSRKILTFVLVIAAILGLVAVGVWYYTSRIADFQNPDDTTTGTETKCNNIYLKTAEGATIPLTESLDPSQPVTIGSQFQEPKKTGADKTSSFKSFLFTINSGSTSVSVDLNEARKEETATHIYYYPEIQFDEYGNANSIQIQVKAEPTSTLPTGADLDCIQIIDVAQPSSDGGDGGVACIAEGETGSQVEGESCCEGLQAGTCTQPDSNNECTLGGVDDCFICTKSGDNECGLGENICNSPTDCQIGSDDGGTDGEPTQCVGVGETGELGKGTSCCSGLLAGSCVQPDSNNQCAPDTTNCYVCIEANDNQCGDGETTCNSPEDCGSPSTGGDDGSDDGSTGEDPEINYSNFAVTKSGPECLERVSPNNTATFQITVTNNDSQYEDIIMIKDKLPLGFTYVEGSTIIDGVPDSNDSLTTVTQVGNSEEIVWQTDDGWIFAAGESMTIRFTAIADTNALTGDNINEVIIIPVNIPQNDDTLRASFTMQVAQSCTTPETGLFDSTLSKVIAGFTIILISIAFYMTATGELLTDKIVNNKVGTAIQDQGRMIGLKLTEPRKYFEEKFEKSSRKSRKSK